MDAESDMWLSSIQTFSSLMAVLAVSFFSNVYVIWTTTRRRFPVRWETFRLTLRYSSVIDLSLCAAIAWNVLRPYLLFHSKSVVTLTLQCARFDVDSVMFSGGMIVASGVGAFARQAVILFTFDHEMALLNQNFSRTLKLFRDVSVVGVACFVLWCLLNRFVPDFAICICFFTGGVTSRAIYVLFVPVVVNIALGVVVVARTTGQVTECGILQSTGVVTVEMSCEAKLGEQTPQSSPDEVSDSRWKRFIIVMHVGLITWFVMTAAMALSGVLMTSLDINALALLSCISTLTTAWNAFGVFAYWTAAMKPTSQLILST
ncbi:hypothetical protein LSAT2_031050 [Lamellibrachia satsuma]|nr:hypothetical protein LSAT2_031050 [Lamellibrachia satsuma]